MSPQWKETLLQGRRVKNPAKIFNDQLDTSRCAFILTGLKDACVWCESGVQPAARSCFCKVDLLSADPLWCSGHCVLLQRNANSQKTGETNSSSVPRWEHGGRVCVLAVIRIMEVTSGNLKRVCMHVCGTVPRRADASWHKTNSNKEKKGEYSSTAKLTSTQRLYSHLKAFQRLQM